MAFLQKLHVVDLCQVDFVITRACMQSHKGAGRRERRDCAAWYWSCRDVANIIILNLNSTFKIDFWEIRGLRLR